MSEEWVVEANYGPPHGWEAVGFEETKADAARTLKDYRDNDHAARDHRMRRLQ